MLRIVLLTAVLGAAVGNSFGAVCSDAKKHPSVRALQVSAGIKAEDSTSASFVFELREAIRKSASYCLVEADRDARFTVDVNALDIEKGELTAISTSIFAPNVGRFFVGSWVSVCGRAIANSCAHDAMARIDDELEKLKD
jgi:hypothetical protein